MFFLEARIEGRAVRWALRQGKQVLGRGPDCDLVLDDRSVSARHLELTLQEGAVEVRDLGSTNGTLLDGRRLEQFCVQPDSWFVAGRVLLAIREGLSLASLEHSAVKLDSTPEGVSLSATSSPEELALGPPSGKGKGIGLEEVLGILEGADSQENLARKLLSFLARSGEARGALFAERIGNGWTIRAAWGEPPPPALDAALDDDSAVPGNESLFLYRPESSGTQCLAAYPWNGKQAGETPLARLAGQLLGRVLPPLASTSWREDQPPVSFQAEKISFLTENQACQKILKEVDQFARAPLPLLLIGESGTGKELLARRLHAASSRRDGPFIAINCSAVPETLLESELFGIEKGVATGVNARTGLIVQASGGTLFLDEAGDLPLLLQPKLLRALEAGEVMPLGAPAPIPVDVRLVSATHRDLFVEVEKGAFRRDLLFRLAGAVIRIPPLHQRPEDILLLARFFAEEAAGSQGRVFQGIDLEAARHLLGYSWPGNVRELRQAMARAVALADGPILHAGLLPPEITRGEVSLKGDLYLGLDGDWREARESFDRLYFSKLLQRCGGNLTEASRLAGLARSNLYRRLEELGLR